MPSLGLLLIWVACAAAQPPGESFIAIFPGFDDRPSTPPTSSDNFWSWTLYSEPQYAPGGLVHLDSHGNVLDFRHEIGGQISHSLLIVNPLNESVCWMLSASYRIKALRWRIRCATLANLSNSWDLPEPRFLNRFFVDELALDEVNQNWYLTVHAGPEVYWKCGKYAYICGYLFDRCMRLEAFGLDWAYNTRKITYDIPNRRLFRLAYNEEVFNNQLDSFQLDGSGRQLLVDWLESRFDLAVDSVTQQVMSIEYINGSAELFTIGYDGKGKRSVPTAYSTLNHGRCSW